MEKVSKLKVAEIWLTWNQIEVLIALILMVRTTLQSESDEEDRGSQHFVWILLTRWLNRDTIWIFSSEQNLANCDKIPRKIVASLKCLLWSKIPDFQNGHISFITKNIKKRGGKLPTPPPQYISCNYGGEGHYPEALPTYLEKLLCIEQLVGRPLRHRPNHDHLLKHYPLIRIQHQRITDRWGGCPRKAQLDLPPKVNVLLCKKGRGWSLTTRPCPQQKKSSISLPTVIL